MDSRLQVDSDDQAAVSESSQGDGEDKVPRHLRTQILQNGRSTASRKDICYGEGDAENEVEETQTSASSTRRDMKNMGFTRLTDIDNEPAEKKA